MTPADPHDLARFVRAQHPVIAQAMAELVAGQKRSHWMWFVFPQIHGLGSSEMAQRYGIRSLDEARAYLAHPVLGARLADCVDLVLAQEGRSASAIFGSPDTMKFCSCLTLFRAAGGGERFERALATFFAGRRDPASLAVLEGL